MTAARRILLVAAANATTGGGERHAADLLRGLARRGYEVGVAAPAGGDLAELAAQLGAAHHPLPLGGSLKCSAVRGLRSVIATFDPAVVHAQGTRAAAFARLADPQAARRVVYTVHGIHVDQGRGSALKILFERLLRRRTARFITVCQADKDRGARLRMLDPALTTVIYNGVAPHSAEELSARELTFRQEAQVSPEQTLILHVGRVSPMKNQRQMLEAFARVHQRFPQTVLALIATGDADQLKADAARLGLTGSTRFLPPRPDLTPAYRGADLFLLPSLWEGLPYVILEAADALCPIVASEVGGIAEVVTPGTESWLTPPGDLDALVETLSRMLELPADERARVAAAAKAHVNTACTLDAMVAQIEDVYRLCRR